MSDELLPCPFCGSHALAYQDLPSHFDKFEGKDVSDSWFVGCPKDCAVVPSRPYRTWETAKATWNRRVTWDR